MTMQQRPTAQMDGPFVVFLIGMRINRLWKLHRWLPLTRSMPRMLAELEAQPSLGMLGGEMWFGRTTILVQYWRSPEQLFAYATDREAEWLCGNGRNPSIRAWLAMGATRCDDDPSNGNYGWHDIAPRAQFPA